METLTLAPNLDEPLEIFAAKKMLSVWNSASRRGLEFDLSYDEILELIKVNTCYYSGVEFSKDGPNKQTFDRIDNTKGYTKSNVVVCTDEVNDLKNQLFEKPLHGKGVSVRTIYDICYKTLRHLGVKSNENSNILKELDRSTKKALYSSVLDSVFSGDLQSMKAWSKSSFDKYVSALTIAELEALARIYLGNLESLGVCDE